MRLRPRRALDEPPRELAQEVDGERGLGLDEREEVVARDRDAADGARRPDARDARAVLDEQRELAEEVPGAQLDRPASELDRHGALADHVHPLPGIVREGEHLARLTGHLGRARRDPLEAGLADPLEGREAADLLDVHARFISASPAAIGTVAHMDAPDLLLPLYGEDVERGDLRD